MKVPCSSFGPIVRVRTQCVDGSGYLARIWFVALDDDATALEAVRAEQGAAESDFIDVPGQLEPDDVQKIGARDGEARPYP